MKTAAEFIADLSSIREELKQTIKEAIKQLGGKVCAAYYHAQEDCDRYTFYDTNNDGYGIELFVELINTDDDGEPSFSLSDSESTYSVEWTLEEFDTSNLIYLLEDIEGIMSCVQLNAGKVVTEYPDYIE